jgi:hypothetical protein
MKQIFYLLAFSFAFFSCSTSKKVSYEDLMAGAPEWVRQSPNDPSYYHGVGSAVKTTQMDFREKAKQNALSDLAGNISVNVSSSSVFSQYEFDKKISEYFKDNIKLSTQSYLEGYELVDSWENADRYWVYYRLSKATYERIKNERIQSALAKSLGDYREAGTFRETGNSAEAMKFYIKATEKIKDFLGEDLKASTDGTEQPYASRLFSDLTSCLQNIRIVYPVKSVDVKSGQKPVGEILNLSVKNESGQNLAGIPVIISYSYFPGKKDDLISDASGSIRLSTGTIKSKRKDEYISSVVNFDKIVKDNSQDTFVRKLLGNFKAPEYILLVTIMPTVFYIEASEKNLNEDVAAPQIQPGLVAALTSDGFSTANLPGNADFIITISANTAQGSERNNKYSSVLTATFSVNNKDGQMVYSQNITGISGLGNSYGEAGLDAYKALISKLRISVLPEMNKQLFND